MALMCPLGTCHRSTKSNHPASAVRAQARRNYNQESLKNSRRIKLSGIKTDMTMYQGLGWNVFFGPGVRYTGALFHTWQYRCSEEHFLSLTPRGLRYIGVILYIWGFRCLVHHNVMKQITYCFLSPVISTTVHWQRSLDMKLPTDSTI